jgi:ABC-type dipeptide/oligopeptide/nickel transport system permease component
MSHWLLAYGLRTSLMVGLLATAGALVIGIAAGLLAAQFGGTIDAAIMRIVDFMLGFPSILIALVLLASIGRGLDKVILAIVLVQWAQYARLKPSFTPSGTPCERSWETLASPRKSASGFSITGIRRLTCRRAMITANIIEKSMTRFMPGSGD